MGNLADALKAAIDWDALPFVTSSELFQSIKTFLLDEKRDGRLICSIDDLYRGFQKLGDMPEEDLRDEFRTCISLLQGRGLIRRLNFGDLVLLQPELLDAYAASLINAAKREPDGLGSITEEEARKGRFTIPEDERIADEGKKSFCSWRWSRTCCATRSPCAKMPIWCFHRSLRVQTPNCLTRKARRSYSDSMVQ